MARAPSVGLLSAGEHVDGRYRIEGLIAEGGMGAVYRATDERLGRIVALKVLLPDLVDDPTCVTRFEREAQAAARLSHPGIVQVFDFGTDASRRLRYLVMEHVQGRTLAQALTREGRLAAARAAEIVEEALHALEAAHAEGIVHRDLKPGNLMLISLGRGGREVVKVLDFGIAQLKATAAYTRLTMTGTIVGTPAYMAPEQARAEPADARTDVYAMGMVLWCALTGRRPFTGRDPASMVQAALFEVPVRADELYPDIPAPIAAAALRALQKDPSARFASAADFAQALMDARGATPRAPSAAGVEPLPEPTARTVTSRARSNVAGEEVGVPAAASGPHSVARPHGPTGVLPTPTNAGTATIADPRTRGLPAERASAEAGASAVAVPRAWLVAALGVTGLGALALVLLAALALAAARSAAPGAWLPGASPPGFGVPAGEPPTPGPAAAPVPTAGNSACERALACCHALEAVLGAGARSCEDVVGMSAGDGARCESQRRLWATSGRTRGHVLPECE